MGPNFTLGVPLQLCVIDWWPKSRELDSSSVTG